MSISLSVPNIAGRVLTEVETKPAKVEKWLAELPLLNVADTARRLYSTLSMYNRMAIEDRDRFALLELYRYPIQQVSRELRKQYIGQPMPLSDRQRTIAEQNRQFAAEMASGYKRLVMHALDDTVADKLSQQEVAIAIGRAIAYLTEVLVTSYEVYAPHPPGVWTEIHSLHRASTALELEAIEFNDPINADSRNTSIADNYQHAILLGIADPYHLPPRVVDRIHEYLWRWAHLARLLPAPDNYDPTCQFLVDQTADRPAMPPGEKIDDPARPLALLNTIELTRTLHDQLTTAKFDQAPELDGVENRMHEEVGQDTLNRLVQAWGVHPKRQFRRSTPGTAVSIDIVAGVERINFVLNGKQRFQVSSSFVGPMPKRTWLGKGDGKPQASAASDDSDVTKWELCDESAGGVALRRRGTAATRLGVGDLVATRPTGSEQPWEISVVRWVKSGNPSDVQIGLQRLAPRAEPVAIKVMHDDKRESEFIMALLLPEIRALKQSETLVVPRGIFKRERVIYLDNACRLYPTIASRLLEITSAFERFRFKYTKNE